MVKPSRDQLHECACMHLARAWPCSIVPVHEGGIPQTHTQREPEWPGLACNNPSSATLVHGLPLTSLNARRRT